MAKNPPKGEWSKDSGHLPSDIDVQCDAHIYCSDIAATFWPRCTAPAKYFQDGRNVCGRHYKKPRKDAKKVFVVRYNNLRGRYVCAEVEVLDGPETYIIVSNTLDVGLVARRHRKDIGFFYDTEKDALTALHKMVGAAMDRAQEEYKDLTAQKIDIESRLGVLIKASKNG